MPLLSPDDRILGIILELGDLLETEHCHGYANCCACSACRDRSNAPLQAPEPVRQPWESEAA